jgi:hypothetical protein
MRIASKKRSGRRRTKKGRGLTCENVAQRVREKLLQKLQDELALATDPETIRMLQWRIKNLLI